MNARILIVDDDAIVARSLAEFLASEGHDTATCSGGPDALAALDGADKAERPFQVLICDVSLPGMDGLEVLRRTALRHRVTAVLMLTGYGSIAQAVEALRLGAVDYLTKPLVDAELRAALARALRQHMLLSENASLRRRADGEAALANVLGSDPRMLKVMELVRAVAPGRTTVLMTGESGTGKSLVARAIHRAGPRRNKPFVELSCGSIPETLLESELFGHVRGAFTGAHTDKPGRFLAASGGTIFLDEINSASPGMQLKLLRVLQERKFEPVGSNTTVEVDARVLLASNQPLEALVASGQFRQDLYYRINVVAIDLPPLRDRAGDIRPLAEGFLREQSAELAKQLTGFTPAALAALCAFRYPGNVRELRNIVERAAVMAQSPTIDVDDLPPHVASPPAGMGPATLGGPWVPTPLEDAMREPERRIILSALRANGWNRQHTAEQLRINRTTLYKKMKSLGIEPERLAG
ncbi:MAG: sigma-54-dependent Fis family transcriptional regulator [Phycisphaerales bacterium]|nr:sigma-54-dependent Fis family transcriptional regulator [Phycisphaerales bacterium]